MFELAGIQKWIHVVDSVSYFRMRTYDVSSVDRSCDER